MRIVAGRWRGRRIDAPPGPDVRPTLDSVREAWMSILQTSIPGARVLDLFAGSGALGLESLSRGAAHAEFVEKDGRVFSALQKNVLALGATSVATLHRGDALRFARDLTADSCDLAFADPPYLSGAAANLASVWLAVRFASILSVEHAASEAMPGNPDTRRYGSTAITIYRSEE